MLSFHASPLTANNNLYGNPWVLGRFVTLNGWMISSQNALKANY